MVGGEGVLAVKVLSRRDVRLAEADTGDRGALLLFASPEVVASTLAAYADRLRGQGFTVGPASAAPTPAPSLPRPRSTVRSASGKKVAVPSSPRRGEEAATLSLFEQEVKAFVAALAE